MYPALMITREGTSVSVGGIDEAHVVFVHRNLQLPESLLGVTQQPDAPSPAITPDPTPGLGILADRQWPKSRRDATLVVRAHVRSSHRRHPRQCPPPILLSTGPQGSTSMLWSRASRAWQRDESPRAGVTDHATAQQLTAIANPDPPSHRNGSLVGEIAIVKSVGGMWPTLTVA